MSGHRCFRPVTAASCLHSLVLSSSSSDHCSLMLGLPGIQCGGKAPNVPDALEK